MVIGAGGVGVLGGFRSVILLAGLGKSNWRVGAICSKLSRLREKQLLKLLFLGGSEINRFNVRISPWNSGRRVDSVLGRDAVNVNLPKLGAHLGGVSMKVMVVVAVLGIHRGVF